MSKTHANRVPKQFFPFRKEVSGVDRDTSPGLPNTRVRTLINPATAAKSFVNNTQLLRKRESQSIYGSYRLQIKKLSFSACIIYNFPLHSLWSEDKSEASSLKEQRLLIKCCFLHYILKRMYLSLSLSLSDLALFICLPNRTTGITNIASREREKEREREREREFDCACKSDFTHLRLGGKM